MLTALALAPPCSCSLFRDPVSRARIDVVWDVLEVASIWVQPWGLAHIGGCRKPAGLAFVLLALLLRRAPAAAAASAVPTAAVGRARRHLATDCATMPLPALAATTTLATCCCNLVLLSAGPRQPALLQCTAVLTFHTILVGVLAPMLLAVFVEHLSPWGPGPAATSEHAQHPRQRPAASGTSDHCGQFSPAANIQHWCQRLDAALKSSRVHLARHPVVACLVAWVALGNLWLASVALAHLQLIS